MNPLFEVSERDIEQLADDQFADILNRLLKAEAMRYRVPPLAVKTTLRVNDPDGGVDARIEHSVALPSVCRIPEGLSVWQYKAGRVTPKEIRETESQKPGVQEAVEVGGSYCFAMGNGCSDIERRNREEAVNDCYTAKGLEAKGRLLLAQDIADWVNDYPAVAMHPHFRRPKGDELFDFDGWENLPELDVSATDFEIDDQRQSIIDEILRVAQDRVGFHHVSIVGRAGVGKTRLALEAIRKSGLEAVTLYVRSPNGIPATLFSHVATNISTELVLIIDECSQEDILHLNTLASRCSDRLLMVTIGQESLKPQGSGTVPHFWLERLDDQAMEIIVRKMAPTIPDGHVQFVVRAAGGYVKLAVAIVQSLRRNPGILGAAKVTGVPDIRLILESLVPDEIDRRAMQALSLFRRIGLDGEVANEGQAVADFMGIDFKELKRVAEEMSKKGLVIKRGRYRYVSPHLLAVWFATDIWHAMSEEIVNDLLLDEHGLPSASSREALLERLADLGEEEIAAPVVEKLLGPDGLFADFEDINEVLASRILGILVMAAPLAGASALNRLLGHLPRDDLLKLREGRRHVVWALESLLCIEETFWDAARLLRELAILENEPYANNATGVWLEMFYVVLGGTPIPASEKHLLILEALEDSCIKCRLLGVRAIGMALSGFETKAHTGPIGGHITPPEWRPKTWGQVWEARRSALKLLDRALEDHEIKVVEAARMVLTSAAEVLIEQGLAEEVIPRLKKLPLCSEAERRDMWELLQRILSNERQALSEDQRDSVVKWKDSIIGTSFHDRLRRWVGKISLVDRQTLRESGERPEDKAASLAEEAYQNPGIVDSEIAWLSSAEAEYSHSFGKRLGELDSDHSYIENLVVQVRGGANTRLLVAYLHGRAGSGESEWVETLLDRWAEDDRKMALAILDASLIGIDSDRSVARIVSLVDKGWILPSSLGRLAWGGWSESLSYTAMGALLECMLRDESSEATEGALMLLSHWLDKHAMQAGKVADQALELLERPCALRSTGMFLYDWHRVAMFYVGRCARRIAEAILSVYEEPDYMEGTRDERRDVLTTALVANPLEVWPLISKVLLREDLIGYRIRRVLRDWGIEQLGIDFLMDWVESNKPEAIHALAWMVNVGDGELADLVREMLIRYGSNDQVRGILSSTFLSGTFWGSEVAWLRSKLAVAEKWMSDPHPQVCAWAREVVQLIEARIKQAQQREEEEQI